MEKRPLLAKVFAIALAAWVGCAPAMAQISTGSKPPTNTVVISASGTYTPTPGMVRIDVYLYAAGGGGGGGAGYAIIVEYF